MAVENHGEAAGSMAVGVRGEGDGSDTRMNYSEKCLIYIPLDWAAVMLMAFTRIRLVNGCLDGAVHCQMGMT